MRRKVKLVKLTQRAFKDLGKIKKFYSLHYGNIKAQEIIDGLFDLMSVLEIPEADFSKIGSIDDDFTHLKYEYRKLIKHYLKITYREGKNNIYVIRIFDTRQDPKKNK